MVIGITGNFGAGKSTVAKMFKRLGARIIDADQIAHAIIKPYSPVYRKILASFGKQVLAGVYISRKRLGEIVFSNQKKLNRLNKIMHPKILKIIKNRIKEFPAHQIIVVDAALLIESGLSSKHAWRCVHGRYIGVKNLLPWIDKLIVVKSTRNIQFQRLKKKGLTDAVIERRISAQLSEAKKVRFADFVIDNSGQRSKTQKQVKEIWDKVIVNREGRRWKR
ncbi:MAG: dephospho-CoA kinase [Candidatus Omnitrophota bacterium]|jgi:dephospho-CoA kinase